MHRSAMHGAPTSVIPSNRFYRYRHFVPGRLKRYQTEGHDHFITFSCYRRLPFLDNDHARTVFLRVLEQLRQRHHFYVFGYVLMPEHVHLLLSEPGQTKLEDVLRALKTQTSRQLKADRKQFWQTRYYDFNVFTHPKFVQKLRYMHRNPVKRDLVQQPEDWPWSSYRHWLTGEASIIEIESHWTWTNRGGPRQQTPAYNSARLGIVETRAAEELPPRAAPRRLPKQPETVPGSLSTRLSSDSNVL